MGAQLWLLRLSDLGSGIAVNQSGTCKLIAFFGMIGGAILHVGGHGAASRGILGGTTLVSTSFSIPMSYNS
jgi:hypothetical protein